LTLRGLEGFPPRIAVTAQVILPLAGLVLPPLGVFDHVAQVGNLVPQLVNEAVRLLR
jgi:hypothetical protein